MLFPSFAADRVSASFARAAEHHIGGPRGGCGVSTSDAWGASAGLMSPCRYLGTPPERGATSIGPPRRMSERLRTRSTSTTIGDPFFEGPRTASPSGMDIDADTQPGYRFEPAVSPPNGGNASSAESTLFISSYSSSITIGLYSLEQTIPTRGVGLAGMLGGLMGGLEELRQGMNRAVDGVAKRAEVAGGPAGMTGGRRAGKGRAWF